MIRVRHLSVILLCLGLLGLSSLSSTAQERPAHVTDVFEAMDVETLLDIMALEGVDYAESLEGDMFPGRGGDRWIAIVQQIYTPERMGEIMAKSFGEALPEIHAPAIVAFYSATPGREIVDLENAARSALLDPAVEEASQETYRAMRDSDAPRLALIEQFVEVNDLLEQNVAGGLNSNFAFYSGLNAGGAFGSNGLPEAEILSDVWSQEEDVRESTSDWVYGYLSMAYAPLEDADFETYIAFSQTEAGQALNRALFAAFNEMFTTVSRDLGLAAAQFIAGEDI